MKPVFTRSITDIAQYATLRGDLISTPSSPERAQEGARQHRRLQKEYPQDRFSAEVSLSIDVERPDYLLRLAGRADGFLQEEETVLIEIKTTITPLDALLETDNPAYHAQMQIYAYIYCLQNSLQKLCCRLVYCNLETKKTRGFTKTYSFAELEALFNGYILPHTQLLDIEAQQLHARNQSAAMLAFPFPSYRENQRALAGQAYTCLARKGILFAAAPTGTGKTISTLFPAVKAQGEGLLDKIFYLTAKNETALAALSGFRLLQNQGFTGRALALYAKEKCCLSLPMDCDPQVCPYAAGFFNRLHNARLDALSYPLLDLDLLKALGEKHTVCPFELALFAAEQCDAIIADYNYLFDPAIRLKRFFERKTNHALLVDEAHNLPSRACDIFSATLAAKDISAYQKNCAHLKPLHRLLGKLKKALRENAEETGTPPLLEDLPLLCGQTLDKISDLQTAGHRLPEGSATFTQLLFGFCKAARYYRPDIARVLAEKNKRVKILSLYPAEYVREALDLFRAGILFSATLTPHEYYMDMCGAANDGYFFSVPSPFPPENLLVLCEGGLRTDYRSREETAPRLAQILLSAVRLKKGNYIAFFPSYRYLEMVRGLLTALGAEGETDITVNTPNMQKEERAAFLNSFRSPRSRPLLGLAVMGGHFGEGVDLPGEQLIGAFVIGVGLPQVSPERGLISDFFSDMGGEGFLYAYVYPGISRVLQAAGRVIRTETDRGFVYLIDARYPREPYRPLLPPHWQVQRADNGRGEKLLADFWQDGKSP